MRDWTFDWKTFFNSGPTKLVKEVIFSKKKMIPRTHHSLLFNNSLIELATI